MGPEDLVFEQKALNNTKNYYDVFYKVEHLLFDKAKKPQNICLIRTKLNIEFNAQVQPIERYKWDHDIEGSVTITDWNWRELDRSVQRKLRTLTLETLPRKKCRHLLKSDFNWAYMCVKIPEDDNFCDFEAGAPVVQNNKLVGITNYGPKCANGEPYIITLSYSYEDLIRTKLLGCGNACPTLDNFYILEVDL
ncbi:chymotrypsin-2-like [Drosophila busckii]|uniref:chymotrypsin-2-like n=1 Tax=Drosophila busckii TaxID=30019 RepID=UPI00083EAE69|nr:chymotrypsin-2-like [Drosophila busckii]